MLTAAGAATASPVATDDGSYGALGRVFPDPLGGCATTGAEPCSPNAQGNTPATQFIQYTEFLDAITYMNSKPEWQPYLEVQVLDGQAGANGDGEGPADADLGIGSPGGAVFPGNNLPLEYDPKPEYRSAGLPRPDLSRQKSDLVVLRVTDETVPDAGKKRYALSLSIHGIERAGVEGGTRAMEDLVTAYTTGKNDDPIVPESVDPSAPTFADALRESIIYFTYPNPDGWRRGSVADDEFGPGAFFQRYNGNGVDLNRDWPDIGFSFRPYSGFSEPESRGLGAYLADVEANGGDFAAGDDLHGQPFADALSYTLLPHGSHDFAKDQRIRDTAIAIHRASEAALLWSPAIQPNAAPPPPCVPSTPVGSPAGDPCFPIYGQTWGTVYDTINYTTTGALGDYFDSSVGLGADGIDNEMSFSHLDKNVNFDPHTEQLHVDGNKALIYAHISQLLDERAYEFDPAGTQGYVPNQRLTREEQSTQPGPPQGTEPQTDIGPELGQPAADTPGSTEFKFVVKSGPQNDASSPDDGKDIFNGGMRVEITKGNVQGVGDSATSLQVQCRGCDRHVGVEDDDEWVTVADDYNQSPVYLQSGLTAAVNFPESVKPGTDNELVEWRALLTGVQAAEMTVHFTHGPATTSGATGGDPAPVLAAYDVANTDFFEDLNGFIEDPAEDFQQVDPHAVIDGTQSLSGLRSLVLADDALPGYTGAYDGEAAPPTPPTGPPTADQTFDMQESTVPGQGPESCERTDATTERYEFTIGPDDGNESLRGTVTWAEPAHDYDIFLIRIEGSKETDIDESVDFNLLTGNAREEVELHRPPAGDYAIEVVNCTTAPTSDADPWAGSLEFEPVVQPPASTFTAAEKDAWFDALREYVEGGGNLVLTDGAVRALRELTDIPTKAVSEQTVYVGQMTFADGEGDGHETLDHPLAANVAQEGARFNTGMRRQTFEPTPLGYSIQDGNEDESNARQWQVHLSEWRAAGGSTAATSADDGERNAAPVYREVTLGELPMGDGHIRIAGALLPQPTQRFDHEFGLEPYAVTYTGYVVACNLLDCTVNSTSTGGGGGGGGGGGDDGSGGGGDGGGTPPPSGTPVRTCQGEPVTIRGTSRSDRLRGTKGDDVIRGRGGNDRISGRRGDDLICAGSGNDFARGGPGSDAIKGGPGRDTCGGPSDKLRSCQTELGR